MVKKMAKNMIFNFKEPEKTEKLVPYFIGSVPQVFHVL